VENQPKCLNRLPTPISQLLVKERIASKDEFRKLVQLLVEHPGFTPQRWNTFEPVRRVFDVDDIDPVIDAYDLVFFWKRKKPALRGCIFGNEATYSNRKHGFILIDTYAGFDVVKLYELASSVCRCFDVHFGYVHEPHIDEVELGKANGTMLGPIPGEDDLSLTVSTHRLRRYIPNLYWQTIFGEPYVTLFGRDKLLSAPVHIVTEMESGCICLQLTPEIGDIRSDYVAFDQLRQRVKQHLNPNAFFQMNMPLRHRFEVPDFGF
jgi:hypothetical protein